MQTRSPTQSTGPLSGVRILDLTSVVLGPIATQILGDFGADVIKVESPAGDMMRSNGVSLNRGMSSIYLAVNRNKRSLSLDLAKPEGKAVLARLVPQADAFVHNMRVEAIERLGFGYEAVSTLNPKIVYCVATGFDQDGPDAAKPAFDDIVQAASGLVSVASNGRDKPDYVPTLVADKTTGMAVVSAVLAALFHRERTGHGQFVEVPMLETIAAFVLAEHMGGMTFDPPKGNAGYARLLDGGRRPHPTKDGYLGLLPYTTDHWRMFFEGAGRPDLAETFAISDRATRNARIRELYAKVGELTREKTTAEWMEICTRLDIPATPIYTLDELPEHPQLKATGLFQWEQHPSEGRIRSLRPTTKFADSPADVRRHAPSLGEHSIEVLREGGFSPSEIDALIEQKIVKQAAQPEKEDA
jgi:formyl-CoA transferase